MTKKKTIKAGTNKDGVVPNQVFLGLPWRTVRPKYEIIIKKLKMSFPIAFVIVGREDSQEAKDLLEVIKQRILTSSFAIFDASGGNANVSFEYGFAEAHDVPRALYLSEHEASKKASKESPIIADLVGKTQNRYKNGRGLEKLLRNFCQQHPYTVRFEHFLTKSFGRRSKGEKKTLRSLGIKLLHQLDGDGQARRADVVQALLADQVRYRQAEIDDMIQRMHKFGLVASVQGPYSTITVR